MKVRLTRKLAAILNGVDVSRVREGEVVDLDSRDAILLLAAGWAERIDPRPAKSDGEAADCPRRARRR